MADPDLSRRLQALSPAKQALLAARLGARAQSSSTPPPISPRPPGSPAPLSFTQERLWLAQALDDASQAFNVLRGARLGGPLDVGALSRSLDALVARHEALRTTIAVVDGEPRQIVGPPRSVSLAIDDLPGLDDAAREAAVAEAGRAEYRRPFDLGADLMLRARLLRLGPEDHALLLALHHVAVDGWSVELLARELAELYGAEVARRAPALPPVSLQYADYAVWQRQLVAAGGLEAQLDYWRRQLGGRLPQLPLPTDRPRTRTRGFRGGRETRLLPRGLADALARVQGEEQVSLFMVLLAALQALLRRYAGEDDVAVASPVAGRDRRELEGVVGCLINDLVLRTDLSGNPTFRELLRRVREVVLSARANQDVPFERVLAEVQAGRDHSHAPLAQVRLTMHEFEHQVELGGLASRPFVLPRETALFDLTVFFHQVEGGIELLADYGADLFDAARIRETLAQFEHLLTQVARDSDVRLDAISLVTPSAGAVLPDPRATLDGRWAGGVHEGFSAQAARRPDAVALTEDGASWTYAQVEARANQLAHAIRAAGVGPEDVVVVYAHRRSALVWAVLGVLKAGAAFTILDPAYPESRLLDCLDAARPAGWIEVDGAPTPGSRLAARVAAMPLTCRVGPGLAADGPGGRRLDDRPTSPPGVPVGPDALSVVTFTSGSTGRPKGILGRHGSLSHFLPWQQDAFGLGPADRFSMLSGLAHDPLQRDMFTALWVGARICVPDPERMGQPGWLAGWMRREGITVSNLTPAMLQMVCATAGADPDGGLPGLRHAFVIGEPLTRHDATALRRLAPRVAIVNLYGCTETQRALGYFVVPDDASSLGKEVIPVGPGMPGCQVLVLSSAGALAGIGEVGEIHVRSPHLARGYLGDEELTARRFVTNPATGLAADRLYRTGDLGRFCPDGTIEFLGRDDDQVKIRGFRIEPGEVETLLRGHPGVRDTVVVPAMLAGDTALVAYVVPAAGPVAPDELRGFLEDRLPAYMVPRVYVALPALPVLPSGKVDRRALPAPDDTLAGSAPEFVAPRTAVEVTLAAIWCDLLRVEKVGVRDNFFDRGGYSLLVVRLLGRIRDEFRVDLPARVPFERPTVEGLALAVLNRMATQGPEGDLLGSLAAMSDEEAERMLAEEDHP